MSLKGDQKVSVSDLIIATLASGRSTKIFREILKERGLKRFQKRSVRVAISRLHKKRYVGSSVSGWYLTAKGKRSVARARLLDYLPSLFLENPPHQVVISFDIPEKNRKIRNWLRNQIKIFNYKMLQQSLWIGPGPLPQEFLQRLEDLKIRKNIKTFKVKTTGK